MLAALGIALFVATGYLWSESLLDQRLGGLERAATAAGLAMMVPVLGDIGLYALHIPLNRASWTALMAVATLSGSALLIVRRRRAAPQATSDTPRSTAFSTRNYAALALAAVVAIGAVVVAREGPCGKVAVASLSCGCRPMAPRMTSLVLRIAKVERLAFGLSFTYLGRLTLYTTSHCVTGRHGVEPSWRQRRASCGRSISPACT